MQSFRQYRRFAIYAHRQLERDRARVQQHNEHGQSQESAPPDSPVGSEESKDDPEKRGSEDVFGLPQRRSTETSNEAEPEPEPEPEPKARCDCGLPSTDQSSSSSHVHKSSSPGEMVEKPEAVEDETEDENEDEYEDDDDDPELAINRRTLSRMTTQQSYRTALGQVLTGIEVRKRSTREGGDGNVFVVGYEGPDDPNNPHNWSIGRRIVCTALIASIGCVVGFASAIDSFAIPQAAKEFGVSEVTESLATALFLAGFGIGSLFAGPISETVGRNPVYIVTLSIFMVFELASALSPNIGAQLAFRFIAGVAGSTPLTCAGGSISDLWSPMERVFAFPVFANAAFTGPLLGPVMGGFIAQSSAVSWRWVDWVTLIFAGVVLTLVVLFQPETYPPILLKWKAKHIRDLTGDDRYRGSIEIRQESLWHRLRRALYRPFLLTLREPIIILLALYLTVIYIVLFGFLDGYNYIFGDIYKISQGLTGLCFIGVIVGLFGASALVPIIYKWAKRDLAMIQEHGGDRLPPEFRLWYSMLGGAIAIPVSLFWMAWTARPDISIWSPLLSSVLFGYGILCVFISCYQYIIDAYETYAASALASISLIRYIASGAMVIVGIPFYKNVRVPYTLTIFACLAALMTPVPYIFYRYGPWIRKKSKYAINATTA